MQKFLQKFDESYKGKQYIEIKFCNDKPLTKKFVRYNQGGEVCHCLEGNTTGSQKTKNGWRAIECSQQCQYRQKNEQGKSACNRIAWLKFFIPSVCQDRIWLMKITGQTSINRIDAYINLQKMLGNPLTGNYILFLKQEEQINKSTGQSFNNYVLDILKKEDFILSNEIQQQNKNLKDLSTINTQNVNNNVVNQEPITTYNQSIIKNTPKEDKKNTSKTTKKSDTNKETIKKETKNKKQKSEEQNIETSSQEDTNNSYEKYYVLDSTFNETITDKNGNSKNYLIGKFYDMQDKVFNIVIRPEYASELQQCDLGTIVELDIKDVSEMKFAMNLKFIDKRIKKVAA